MLLFCFKSTEKSNSLLPPQKTVQLVLRGQICHLTVETWLGLLLSVVQYRLLHTVEENDSYGEILASINQT